MCVIKINFLISQCCGYSKEPSHGDGSFGHPKHDKILLRNTSQFYPQKLCLSGTMNRGGSRISGKWVQISCVKRVEGGGLLGFISFLSPHRQGLGDIVISLPGIRPSVFGKSLCAQ